MQALSWNVLGNSSKWMGGKQQEDAMLARLECKSMKGWKILPVVSSDCLGEDIKGAHHL